MYDFQMCDKSLRQHRKKTEPTPKADQTVKIAGKLLANKHQLYIITIHQSLTIL